MWAWMKSTTAAEAQPVDDVADRAARDGAQRGRHQPALGAPQPDPERHHHAERHPGQQQVAPLAEAGQQAESHAAVPHHGEVEHRQQDDLAALGQVGSTMRIHHLLAWSASSTTRAATRPSRVRRLRVIRWGRGQRMSQETPSPFPQTPPARGGGDPGFRPSVVTPRAGKPARTPPRRRSARRAWDGPAAGRPRSAPASSARICSPARRADGCGWLPPAPHDPHSDTIAISAH